MKRPIMWIGCLVILYCILFDLSKGTLPIAFPSEPTTAVANNGQQTTNEGNTYYEMTVASGDTVLTLVERVHKKQVSIPIEQIVADFKKLNNGRDPLTIQPGNKVLIPIYP